MGRERLDGLFIGTQLETPKCSTLTVIGYDIKEGKYIIKCSVCSLDNELFYDKVLSSKSNLISGNIPCGCGKSPRWSERQYKIRVEREAKIRGYIFLGWAEDFKGNKTKIRLYDTLDKNTWETTCISSFINNGYGNPVVRDKKNSQEKLKPDEYHINDFLNTGKFREDSEFWRIDEKDNNGRKPYWNYKCPICYKDEYVDAGLCTGVFKTTMANLKKGLIPCRCGKYIWSKDQREYQIKNICQSEGFTFKRWVDGYEGKLTKFEWVCSKGHSCTTNIDNFINVGRRCRKCSFSKNSYGYYQERADDIDYLYINYVSEENYLKIGRTFNPATRFKQNNRRVKSYNATAMMYPLKLFTGTHNQVYSSEQLILNNLSGYSVDGYGSIELLSLNSLHHVLGIIESKDLTEVDHTFENLELDQEKLDHLEGLLDQYKHVKDAQLKLCRFNKHVGVEWYKVCQQDKDYIKFLDGKGYLTESDKQGIIQSIKDNITLYSIGSGDCDDYNYEGSWEETLGGDFY